MGGDQDHPPRRQACLLVQTPGSSKPLSWVVHRLLEAEERLAKREPRGHSM